MIRLVTAALFLLSAAIVLTASTWKPSLSAGEATMQMSTPPGEHTAGVIIAVDDECDIVVRVRGEEITPEMRAKQDRLVALVRRLVREGS